MTFQGIAEVAALTDSTDRGDFQGLSIIVVARW
jgi:hypothetical protein